MSQQLIARDRELRVLLDALDAARPGARAVVLEGEAGLGKTALWRQALDAAPDRGWRVLASAPARSEARLAFAALGDLFDVDIEPALSALPGPQRRALEAALLRHGDEPSIGSVDERMIGVAIEEPILVLATRRLQERQATPVALERMLGDERVQRLRIGPLSLGGVHELLLARLGFEVSRPTLLRLHELTTGNPFYSLEISRELIARGLEPAPHERLPVPGNVRELVQGGSQNAGYLVHMIIAFGVRTPRRGARSWRCSGRARTGRPKGCPIIGSSTWPGRCRRAACSRQS